MGLLSLLGLLYALQAVAGILVYFSLDRPWLSLPLGLAFVAASLPGGRRPRPSM